MEYAQNIQITDEAVELKIKLENKGIKDTFTEIPTGGEIYPFSTSAARYNEEYFSAVPSRCNMFNFLMTKEQVQSLFN